jgi:hypothetical protein
MFSAFRWLSISLNLTGVLWYLKVVIYGWNFWLQPNDGTSWLRNLSIIEARSRETLNIKVIEESIAFLKRVKTQNFDIRWREHEGLKLEWFSRYDLELESIFKFLLFLKINFLMQHECMMSCNISVLYVLYQKKKLTKYRCRTYSQWQSRTHPRSQF